MKHLVTIAVFIFLFSVIIAMSIILLNSKNNQPYGTAATDVCYYERSDGAWVINFDVCPKAHTSGIIVLDVPPSTASWREYALTMQNEIESLVNQRNVLLQRLDTESHFAVFMQEACVLLTQERSHDPRGSSAPAAEFTLFNRSTKIDTLLCPQSFTFTSTLKL